VSFVVRFSPDLGAWLVQGLAGGSLPAVLVDTMVQERMDRTVARAIVDAFVAARLAGKPVPVDAITIDEKAADYVYEAPLLPAGSRITTGDRVVRVEARADQPVLAVLRDVLSADECAALVERARPRLTPSTIVDPATGRDVVADHRTSHGMFFRLGEDDLIARLDRRVSEVMNLPVENGEGFQVLYYPTGGVNTPHFDFLQPSNQANQASIARSGQRVSTLIAYLNDVEEGGETIFPAAGWSVAPLRGNAVYFEYCNRLGQVDARTVHGSNAVTRGEKWVVTKWMRQRRFVPAGAASSEGMVRG
jgi:prolyl 4-hydroxylase